MGVDGQHHAPAALPPGKRSGIHCIGGWVSPRTGLDGCGKSRPPPPGFDPRTVQPVGSRYTDYAIPAHPCIKYIIIIIVIIIIIENVLGRSVAWATRICLGA